MLWRFMIRPFPTASEKRRQEEGATVPVFSDMRWVQTEKKGNGPDGSRTRDLMNAIHARSQLRYWPTLGRGETLIIEAPSNSVKERAWRSLRMYDSPRRRDIETTRVWRHVCSREP